MDREKLNANVLQDLADRSLWDTRQRMFYEMRHHGLRRKTKPWPTASDAHFPLSDSILVCIFLSESDYWIWAACSKQFSIQEVSTYRS